VTITISKSTTASLRVPVSGGDLLEGLFSSLTIDAVLHEQYDVSARATEHAVEDGAAITDHVHPALQRVTLECIVSNSIVNSSLLPAATTLPQPVILPPRRHIIPMTFGAPIILPQAPIAPQVLTAPLEEDRVKDVMEKLRDIVLDATRVDILGLRIGDLYDWLLVGLTPRVEGDDHVEFTLECQEIRTATVSQVGVPSPRVERGRPQASRGRQPGASVEVGVELESRLHAGLNGIYGAMGLPQLR
jgi:hypothetical protein